MTSVDFVLDRIERLLERRVRPAIYPERRPVTLSAWRAPGEPVSFADATAQDFAPFDLGTAWGAAWSTWWFRITATIPDEWRGRTVELVIDPGFVGDWPGGQVEGMLYDADGAVLKAIHPRNQQWRVTGNAQGSETVECWFEAAANPDIMADGWTTTDQGDVLTSSPRPLYTFTTAELAVFDDEVWQLYFDLEVLWQLAKELPVPAPRRHHIAKALSAAADILDLRGVGAGAEQARAVLAPALASPAEASAHTLSAIGHAHIDCAWLWPVRETVRKCSRTFANALWLAEHYPEFRFACSSAQQYDWVERTNPALFARIRDAVDAGTWIPVGGMWVEPDGNLPSGESLVRQLTYGQRYFADRFGLTCDGMWIPDSFGYTAAYPQLAKLAGMRWFLTQKISWNQTNKFPHHTFWWEGIDGTRLLTHFAPVDNYVSTLEGHELAHAVRNFTEHAGASSSLVPFGFGDGGGGPVRDMMERARRVRDLEGSPRLAIEHPRDFFERTRAEYPDAPVWLGELYLELHRGTFTSQAAGKRGNRRVESLLHAVELAWTQALVRDGATYPREQLDEWWKRLLLQQFHDILPGSSIAWVHRDAAAEFDALVRELSASLAEVLPSGESAVFNPAPVHRREVLDIGGAPALIEVAALSGAPVVPKAPEHPVTTDGERVSNGLISYSLGEDGTISSIVDERTGRELVAPGQRANLLRLHPDYPNNWDAWDVDEHYRNTSVDLGEVAELTVIESGPLRHRVRVVRRLNNSTFTQHIELAADDPRIVVTTAVDWRERERLLKQCWPLALRAEQASAEIQFGHVTRATHTNTSWQEAQFENYAHRWIRVAEPDYGVAITTDATYGYDTRRIVADDGEVATSVNLSLLRAPNFPDPRADLGSHQMTCAIALAPRVSDAIAAGYRMNMPVVLTTGAHEPLVRLSGEGGYVETVKAADDGSGDVIVRLYEGHGTHTRVRLHPSFPVAAMTVVDLAERPMEPRSEFASSPEAALIGLKPFEVVTIRLTRGES